jgi:hypothetical protein
LLVKESPAEKGKGRDGEGPAHHHDAVSFPFLIHPSAWKRLSTNFAITAFSEVRRRAAIGDTAKVGMMSSISIVIFGIIVGVLMFVFCKPFVHGALKQQNKLFGFS